MGGGGADRNGPQPSNFTSTSSYTRNLEKSHLGGVIFGCTNNTMNECLSKQIFGLPAAHFSYVKNIQTGLPLFLFNYNNKKLHGIFEAASSGQMNIDPYGWTTDGSCRTQYPAQVQVHVRSQCHPLPEEKFKPVIADNYYNRNHFWFELDHAQTSKLISLFSSSPVASGSIIPANAAKWRTIYQPVSFSEKRAEEFETLFPEAENKSTFTLSSFDDISSLDGKTKLLENQVNTVKQVEKDLTLQQLQGLALNHDRQDSSLRDYVHCSTARNDMCIEDKSSAEEHMGVGEKNEETSCASSDCQSIIARLVQESEELKAFKTEHTIKMHLMKQKLVEAEEQIQHLKDRCLMLESVSNVPSARINDASDSFYELNLDPTKSMYLVGGYNGESWLSALDLYFPSEDVSNSLRSMNTDRSYASVAKFDDEIYVFGGGNGYLWYDTVESYNPAKDQWTFRPSLTRKRGSLGGATLKDKLFAVGGGDGSECFSCVEMLDLDIGRWIPTRSMLEKRFALAAVDLNGVLYATGGFDGSDYLRSTERFDPREHCWTRIANMNTKRGCHSMVVLNEKLYALGGFDGNKMVPSIEVYDPRLNTWINGEPMKTPRGYSAAVVSDECIYVIGGLKDDEIIVDTIEHFRMGEGWQESKMSRKRCFLSAIALP